MKDINIEDFSGIEAEIDYQPILDKYGELCAEKIKEKSPVRTGSYRDGWVAEADKDYLGEYSVVVWNQTSWQLTHLLENGHAIVNKKGGVGRASPRPHIKKGYNAIKNEFVRAMKEVNINFK